MSDQIPAGWYPDPKDTDGSSASERWWDGHGWTASTRPVPEPGGDAPVIEGQVVGAGPTVRYPELPSETDASTRRSGPARPVLIAAAVAAAAGLLVGSGVTYLLLDGRSDRAVAVTAGGDQEADGTGANDGPSDRPSDGPSGGPNGGRKGGKGGVGADTAVDMVNRIVLPVPSGWKGGTTTKGFAALTVGKYTCADGSGDCTLGGAATGRLDGTDPKQAAQNDIAGAAKESYGEIKSHQELKSEPVTVAGRSGYLVRWKVAAPQGNDGYVETVAFPTADGKALVSLRLGFDIAAKAPDLAQMDAIVKSVTDYTGPDLGGGSGGART